MFNVYFLLIFTTDISITPDQKQQAALKEISKLLHCSGKTLVDFTEMPKLIEAEHFDYSNHLILQELNYDRKLLRQQTAELVQPLNHDQLNAYSWWLLLCIRLWWNWKNILMECIGFFFES